MNDFWRMNVADWVGLFLAFVATYIIFYYEMPQKTREARKSLREITRQLQEARSWLEMVRLDKYHIIMEYVKHWTDERDFLSRFISAKNFEFMEKAFEKIEKHNVELYVLSATGETAQLFLSYASPKSPIGKNLFEYFRDIEHYEKIIGNPIEGELGWREKTNIEKMKSFVSMNPSWKQSFDKIYDLHKIKMNEIRKLIGVDLFWLDIEKHYLDSAFIKYIWKPIK